VARNYSIAKDHMEDMRDAIRQAYNVDFFMLLSSADGQRTAFEVQEIQGEKALILAPTIARLTHSFDRVLERVMDIEARAGRMPDVPPILEDMGDAGELDIQYLGPLAQIQARLFESRGIPQGLAEIAPILQIAPDAADRIDFDEIVESIAKSRNWPQRTIRSDEQVAELRQARQQAQAEAEQLAKAGEGAKALKDAASANQDMDGAFTDSIMQAVTGE
jgi:hypothetical protein